MAYAVIETGGKQFRVVPGARLRVPTLRADPGSSVTFDRVLLAGSDEGVRVGSPVVDGASVSAEILRHGRSSKIVVFKRKRRKGYRRKQGHRQGFTEVLIAELTL